MRFRLTFLEFALSVFLIDSVFLEEVSLRQQTFVNSHFDGRLTGACILSDDVQRLIEERLICFQISGLHLIPDLGISSLAIGLAHAYRQRVVTAVTAEGLYQLGFKLEVCSADRTGNTDNDGIFLGVGFCSYDLLKRTCRNSIGIMLTGFQFLTLGHHLLHDRESVSSLSLDGILGRTKVYQVSYRFKLLICITNFINLLFRNDIPCGIYILLIEAIPFQRNQRQALSCDGIERLYRQFLRPEANRSGALKVDKYNAVLQYVKGAVLKRNFTLGIGCKREVLNRRSLFYRAREHQLSYALTGFILAVLDMKTDIVTVLHHLMQIHYVPEVCVGSLRITGNPVERNSGCTTCTFRLLGQTNLEFNRLRRNHAYVNGILNNILKHITRELTAIRTVRRNRHSMLLVLNRVRTLKRKLGLYFQLIGCAEVLHEYSGELSRLLTCFFHCNLIPNGIVSALLLTIDPVELLGCQTCVIRLVDLRRSCRSPELDILAGLQTNPNGIGHSCVHRVVDSALRSCRTGSYRTGYLLKINIRAGESNHCF